MSGTNGDASGGASEGATPLDGLRVIEIAAGRAVAYCAQLLAQFGAEVIRIEPPGGDPIRLGGPFSGDEADRDGGGLHAAINRGKRSIVLDLERDEEAALAARLVEGAALLVSDWREGERLPPELPLADAVRMAERFPGTTFVSISDFGMTGPYASWRADSHIIEGLAGFSYVSGDPDREPLSAGIEISDYFAATHATIAALAAVAAARRGERTHVVDVSAHEALTMTDDHNLVVWLGSGVVRKRYYSRILPGYPNDIMACKDGYIAFVPVGTGHHDFAGVVSTLLERPDLKESPIFTETQTRNLRWQEFDAVALPWLARHTREEIFRRAGELGLGFGTVPDVEDLLADSHLEQRDYWEDGPGGVKLTGAGAILSATPQRFGPAPALDADGEALRASVSGADGAA